jgi:hypothetical protein
MATNRGKMSDETFRQLIKEDYWISNIAKACEGVSKEGAHLYWRTVTYPDEYYVSEDQISFAKKEFKRRHDEMLAGIAERELCFVAMGMDYEKKGADDIGNYRICCEFTNLDGKQFFIEFSSTNFYLGSYTKEHYYVSYSIDRGLEKQREQEREKVFNWNRRFPRMMWKPVPDMQDYHNAMGVCTNSYIERTWSEVLDFVNRKYKCNYKCARLFEHFFVDYKEYVCHC